MDVACAEQRMKEGLHMKKKLGADAIAFPTPVYIVGTYDSDGVPNAMNVAWGGLCSSEPPCVMIAIRKGRYTYRNIDERKAFTVNFPDRGHVKEADYFGLISGEKTHKFDNVELTVTKSEFVDAPIIEEFPVALECRYVKSMEVGQHIMIVGEILNISVDEEVLDKNGDLDVTKIDPLIYDPAANKYNAIGEVVGDAFKAGIGLLPDNK